MEEVLNGNSKDVAHQKLDAEEDGIDAQLDDETLRMGSVVAVIKNGKEEKGLASSSSSSSSSDDEEAEVIVTEKTDETVFTTSTGIYDEADQIAEEEAVEIESSPDTKELKVIEVIEEHIGEVVEETADEEKRSGEEEREVIIIEESQTVEAFAVELADVEPDPVESVEEVLSTTVLEAEYADQEGTDRALQCIKEDDSFLANAKSINGTDDNSHKAELPETNGNPQIISISSRTMQPTSWRGCCGLLEVFKRGDR